MFRPRFPELDDFLDRMNVSRPENESVSGENSEVSRTETEIMGEEETISTTVYPDDRRETLVMSRCLGGGRGWSPVNFREGRPSPARMQQLLCNYFSSI